MIIRTGAPAGPDRHRHRNRNRPRPPRLAFRLAAVGLLLLGAGGSAYLGEERSRARERAEAAAAAVAHRAELGALRRLAEANRRTDRDRRSPLAETIEQAEARAQEAARQRVSRADGVKESPPPPPPAPPPRPEPEPAAGAPAGPVPGSCGGYSGNRATGCTLLLAAGWSLDQMSCLDSLWTKESGWNHRAQNPSSGAYGIPQALPGDKMATHGDDWRTNPATQIRWGLDYLDNRYGSPCAAWQFSQANGWY